jgi:hypothetical protein
MELTVLLFYVYKGIFYLQQDLRLGPDPGLPEKPNFDLNC